MTKEQPMHVAQLIIDTDTGIPMVDIDPFSPILVELVNATTILVLDHVLALHSSPILTGNGMDCPWYVRSLMSCFFHPMSSVQKTNVCVLNIL